MFHNALERSSKFVATNTDDVLRTFESAINDEGRNRQVAASFSLIPAIDKKVNIGRLSTTTPAHTLCALHTGSLGSEHLFFDTPISDASRSQELQDAVDQIMYSLRQLQNLASVVQSNCFSTVSLISNMSIQKWRQSARFIVL